MFLAMVELLELVVCPSLNPLMYCTIEYNTTWIRLSVNRHDKSGLCVWRALVFRGISVTVKGAVQTDTVIKSFRLTTA